MQTKTACHPHLPIRSFISHGVVSQGVSVCGSCYTGGMDYTERSTTGREKNTVPSAHTDERPREHTHEYTYEPSPEQLHEQLPEHPREQPTEQTNKQPQASARYAWLSSLRAFGLVLVLIYHFFPAALPAGFIGVDVFFVFSGFLITSLLIREYSVKGRIALGSFYLRRLKRLLPAVLAMLVVTLPLALLISPDFRVGIAQQVAAVLGWVTNYYEIINGQSYANQLLPHLFVHTWTLSIEMQYYLIWGLLLALLAGRLSRQTASGRISTLPARRVLSIIAAAGALVSFIIMQILLVGAADPSRAYFDSLAHIYPLLIGSFVGLVAGFPRTRLVAAVERLPFALGLAVVALCLVAIVALAWLLSFENRLVYHLAILLTALLSGAILVIGRAHQARLYRIRENRLINYLAERSYSLYLFHWPLFIIASNLGAPGSPIVLPGFQILTTWVFPLLALVATFVCAHLCYRFVESPFTSTGRKARAARAAQAAAPGAHAVAAVATLAQTATRAADAAPVGEKSVPQPARRLPLAGKPALLRNRGRARSVSAAIAVVLVAAASLAVLSAPAKNTVTATNAAESLALDLSQLSSLSDYLDKLRLEPAIGMGTTAGLPPRPSEGVTPTGPPQAALDNMELRARGEVAGSRGTITVLGDSVCLGAVSQIEQLTGAYVDADGFRKMQDAVPLVKNLQASGALGEYLVIAMSTNIFSNSIEKTQEIIDLLEPGHHLIFVTAYGIDLEFYGLDAFLRELPSRYPWISLADWKAYISEREDLLHTDGIHTGGEEARTIYAQCILDAVRAAEGGARS